MKFGLDTTLLQNLCRVALVPAGREVLSETLRRDALFFRDYGENCPGQGGSAIVPLKFGLGRLFPSGAPLR
jgi:hypothetical protein